MTSTDRAPVGVRPVAAAAALMLGAAVGAHVAAGGAVPPLDVLAVVAAVLTTVAVVVTRLAGRRWTGLGLVAAGQYGTHQLLVVTSHRAAGGPGPALCAPGHRHGAAVSCLDGSPAGTLAVDGGPAWVDARMVVLHLAATVAVGLLLVQGDRLLASLVAALRPLWRRPTGASRPVRPATVRVEAAPVVVPSALVWVDGRPRRGPPRLRGVPRCLPA